MLDAYLNEHRMRHTSERIFILEAICRLKSFHVDELRAALTDMTILPPWLHCTTTHTMCVIWKPMD